MENLYQKYIMKNLTRKIYIMKNIVSEKFIMKIVSRQKKYHSKNYDISHDTKNMPENYHENSPHKIYNYSQL